MSGELAEAEQEWREKVDRGLYVEINHYTSARLLAEYDRRGAIVEAASALVEHYKDVVDHAAVADVDLWFVDLLHRLSVVVASKEERP